jgi:hypothetical protein
MSRLAKSDGVAAWTWSRRWRTMSSAIKRHLASLLDFMVSTHLVSMTLAPPTMGRSTASCIRHGMSVGINHSVANSGLSDIPPCNFSPANHN